MPSLQGCFLQPDQENYGIGFIGSLPPPSIARRDGHDQTTRTGQCCHPSSVLPPQVRFEHRRLCETKHNMRCKDVGLGYMGTTTNLLVHLHLCRISQMKEEVDAEELDEVE